MNRRSFLKSTLTLLVSPYLPNVPLPKIPPHNEHFIMAWDLAFSKDSAVLAVLDRQGFITKIDGRMFVKARKY